MYGLGVRPPLSTAHVATLALVGALALFHDAVADDVLHPGALVLDRPTLVSLGVQLLVSGDDNHTAEVGVRYRALGTSTWRAALPLFRVRPESVVGWVVPEQFAGTIFELSPATTYEIELHATDADGAVDEVRTAVATTRGVPGDPATPSSKSVATTATLQAALASAQPGDVITVAEGTYTGPFQIAASGTATNPIVVRGTTREGTILDGRRCKTCNLLEITGSFVHVERLTVQGALRGVRFKGATEGVVVRGVHVHDVTIGMIGDPDERDFYLCDNLLEGRLVWPHVYSDDGGRHASDDGINVKGFGHVVCHNRIGGFGDAMKVEQNGARADDFYGNEVVSAYDNGVELDTSEGNTRAFRNRFTNTFVPLSFQPTFGGPVYAVRNVVVNAAEDQLKLYALNTTPPQEPSGVLVLRNTFVSAGHAISMESTATSHHVVVQGNVFVGPAGAMPVVDWTGPLDDGSFDYDAFFPNGTFDFHGAGTWASFAAMQAGGRFEAHGVLLSASPFASGLTAPATYKVTLTPQDPTLGPGSEAVDAGSAMPNVDDGFTGSAPDLGAAERGCPLPIYGIRPDGVDERNEPRGCATIAGCG